MHIFHILNTRQDSRYSRYSRFSGLGYSSIWGRSSHGPPALTPNFPNSHHFLELKFFCKWLQCHFADRIDQHLRSWGLSTKQQRAKLKSPDQPQVSHILPLYRFCPCKNPTHLQSQASRCNSIWQNVPSSYTSYSNVLRAMALPKLCICSSHL
jgi:hypothetical protein